MTGTQVFAPFPSYLEWRGRPFMGGDTVLSYLVKTYYEEGRNVERRIEMQQVNTTM